MTARSITIAAALVLNACVLAAVPLAAFGDDAPAPSGPSPEVAELLEVREEVNALNEQAREAAPAAVGNSCRATLDVEGIGDSCVDPSGLIRVEQADGRSHTIHGMDAPPTSAAAFTPVSQSAVNGADASDVSCVDASQPHYVLVYARPGNVTSRYGTVAPQLRNEIYKLSAFIDAEARSVDAASGRRLPVRCEGSTPAVLQATLSGLSAGTATFQSIVDALRGQGYEFNGSGTGKERYIVYYDSPSPSGAAGTGHVFTRDTSASAGNQNNKGGLYAVEYRFDQGGGVPHWEVLVHEVMHTMGAVVETAPHTTGAGAHCTDGRDIMCYDDGFDGTYSESACGTKVLDCNRDDYFHPAPAAGSYLATHWNTAATYNSWLRPTNEVRTPAGTTVGDDGSGATDGGGGSTTPEGSVSGLIQAAASNRAVGLAWRSTPNARSYTVSVRSPGGRWRTALTSNRTRVSVGGLAARSTYEVAVAARTSSGLGARTLLTVATNGSRDRARPSAPGRVRARGAGARVQLSWRDARDNVGVARYELRRVTRVGRRNVLRGAGATTNSTMSLSTRGLRRGVAYRYVLLARDSAGNASVARSVVIRLAVDRARPTAPATTMRTRATSRSSVTVRWGASRDNVGVARYEVYQRVGRRWVKLRVRLSSRARAVRVTGLRPRTTYTFKVHARDTSGNLSRSSRAIRARTR